MKYLFVCLSLGLTGCGSIPLEQVEQRISAWHGAPIEDLIKFWGLPSKKQLVNGQAYAEWLNRSSEPGNTSLSIGTNSHSRHSGIGIGVNLFDLGGTDDECSRLVAYDEKGKVTQITWTGTREFCFKLTPERKSIESTNAR